MTINKNTDLEFSLQQNTEKGGVYTNFYTEDKGSASIRIRLSNQGYYLDLTKTDLKPVLFLFHDDGSIFEIKDFMNVMPEQGLIQYNFSDNVIKHAGKVKAKVFLKSDTKSIHVANFTFDIKDSGIEGAVAKEINVNIVDDAVRRIVKENAIELLDDEYKEKINQDVIEYVASNPDKYKGPKGDTGSNGIKGEKGDKGDKGDTLKYADLSTSEKEDLKSNITDEAINDFVIEDASIKTSKIADKSITPYKTDFIESGKNLFNKEKATRDGYINENNGEFVSLANYFTTDYIKIKKGQPITTNSARKIAIYDSKLAFKEGFNQSTGTHTYTPSSDGYIRYSFPDNHIGVDNVQVEYGTTNTDFEPYYLKLSDSIQTGQVNLDTSTIYNLNKNGDDFSIKSKLNNKELELRTQRYGSKNNAFNFDRTFYDGKLIHYLNDDITPVRTFSTVGANHGYTTIIDLPNSNKTTADLGSTWTDGTTNYVLLRIVDGRLILGCPYAVTNGYVTASTIQPKSNLTHVSNATNTENISITGIKTGSQLYPSTGKIKVDYLADGNIVEQDGNYKCNEVTIIESYEILDYRSILDFATTHIGQDYADSRNEIQGVLSMSNTFNFNNKGNCTTSHAIRALQKVLMGMSGVLQSVVLQHPNLPVKRYIPNLGVVNGFDFTQPFNVDDYNSNNRIVKANLIEQDKPLDRYIDYIVDDNNIEIAFTLGHIVDKTNSKYSDRLTNISSIYWDFRSTKKSYPNVIHNKILNEGDYFNFEGYRNYFVPDKGVINSNKVIDNETTYIYIDSLNTENYKSTEFSELIGSKLEVVSSKGFELKSNIVDANGINYAITENKGYAVLKTV